MPMQWVDVSSFDPVSETTSVRVRFLLDGDVVRWEGDDALGSRLAADGVSSTSLGRQTHPADGEAFLLALGEEFRSGYFFAGEIQEGQPPPLA